MNKKAEGGIVVLIIILVAGYLIANNVSITYKTEKVEYPDAYCKDGNVMIKKNMMGIAELGFSTMASLTCIEYRTARCFPSCVGDDVVCKCKATIRNIYFDNKGVGIFD